MRTDSFIPLPLSVVWLLSATSSVRTDGGNSDSDFLFQQVNFLCDTVYIPVVFFLPLAVSLAHLSIYTLGQFVHEMWYTTQAFSYGVYLSLGCISKHRRVIWGFMAVETPCWWKAQSSVSDMPFTYNMGTRIFEPMSFTCYLSLWLGSFCSWCCLTFLKVQVRYPHVPKASITWSISILTSSSSATLLSLWS